MSIKITVVLCCLAFALLIKESSAVRCYNCTSCNDPFNKNGVSTMDCGSFGCMKTKADGIVARTCAPGQTSNQCNSASVLGQTVNVCVCSLDLCNAATSTSTFSITAALMLAVGVLVYRRLL